MEKTEGTGTDMACEPYILRSSYKIFQQNGKSYQRSLEIKRTSLNAEILYLEKAITVLGITYCLIQTR